MKTRKVEKHIASFLSFFTTLGKIEMPSSQTSINQEIGRPAFRKKETANFSAVAGLEPKVFTTYATYTTLRMMNT